MIVAALAILGLCLGSFVNALVWRVHQQALEKEKKRPDRERLKKLSVAKGRSMCPNCGHELAITDLLPLVSWLALRGRCRYCGKPISFQYPLVEASVALTLILSYLWWPLALHGSQKFVFACWVVLVTGLAALFVYDLRWSLLPDRIVFAMYPVGMLIAGINVFSSNHAAKALLNLVLALLLSGGLFYVLFQISKGRWIGGGDVKLGWLLGLVAGTAGRSLLLIFLASLLGSLISLPLLASKRMRRNSTIPFGPFLIVALVVVQLFGHSILFWYQKTFFPYTV